MERASKKGVRKVLHGNAVKQYTSLKPLKIHEIDVSMFNKNKVVPLEAGKGLLRIMVAVCKKEIQWTHNDVDVTSEKYLKIIKDIKPDVIINTTAYVRVVRVNEAEFNPNEAFKVNAIGGSTLCVFRTKYKCY